MACLPTKNICLDIIVISKLLSERHTNGLADFHAMYQHDPVAKKAISRFDTRTLRVCNVLVEYSIYNCS